MQRSAPSVGGTPGTERGQRLRARHAPPAPHGARRAPGAAPAAAAAGRPPRRRPLPRALPLRWAPRRLQPPGVEPAARAAAAGGGAAVSIGAVGTVAGSGHRPVSARPPSSAPRAADGRALKGARVRWRGALGPRPGCQRDSVPWGGLRPRTEGAISARLKWARECCSVSERARKKLCGLSWPTCSDHHVNADRCVGKCLFGFLRAALHS